MQVTECTRIGIRESRENLAEYIESSAAVAISRDAETVGFYMPGTEEDKTAGMEALRFAGERLDALIAAADATKTKLVEDFKQAPSRARAGCLEALHLLFGHPVEPDALSRNAVEGYIEEMLQ